ncbi:glycoside hydrolase domain-containing protein [Marinilabilia salmonicolor]|nr:glycoside hydrolase domain-containing protein [Marinilabilia salmonicolor]
MKIDMGDGKHLTIKAPKVSDKNRYIEKIKLNGKEYNRAYISFEDIKDGAELEFFMTSKPNNKRVFKAENKPYSLSNLN